MGKLFYRISVHYGHNTVGLLDCTDLRVWTRMRSTKHKLLGTPPEAGDRTFSDEFACFRLNRQLWEVMPMAWTVDDKNMKICTPLVFNSTR